MKTLIILSTLVLFTITVNAQKSLPKCGKYSLEIKNKYHSFFCSKNRWIMGYILIDEGGKKYFDVEGNEIDSKKVLAFRTLPVNNKPCQLTAINLN